MTGAPLDDDPRSWTVALRTRLAHAVPAGQILPGRQPAYVLSWIYVFGVLALRRSSGYLSQTNVDSQFITTQAKDGLNAVGVGAYFNVLDTSQMLLWHVTLLPAAVGVLVVLHVVLVRRHGVVPPFDADPAATEESARVPQDAGQPVLIDLAELARPEHRGVQTGVSP